MGNKGALIVRFAGDARDLNKTTKKVSKSMAGLKAAGKVAAVGMAAAAAGAVVVGKALFDASEKAGTSNARITQVFKSMDQFGKSSDKVAGRVVKLSDAMARKTGIDQNQVKQGAAILSTFSNISKSADKMGGTFDKTLGLATDLSAAGFGSVESASTMLGKALQDPTKGLTALNRVGVTFTDGQKKQIKAMQEAGNVAGAQKIILKGVQGQVGGVAKATANASDQIKVGFSQVVEKVGLKLVPAFKGLTDFVLNVVLPTFEKKVAPALVKFGDWIVKTGVPALKVFGGWVKDNVLPPLQTLGGFLVNSVVPALMNLGKWLVKNREVMGALAIGLGVGLVAWKAYIFFTVGVPAIISAITLAQKGLNAALKANPIGIVITVIAALVAALVWFFTKTKAGQAIVKAVWSGIQSAIKGVADWWTKTAWPAIKGALKSMGDWFRSVGRGVGRAFRWMGDALGNVWRWIKKNVIDRFVLGVKVWAVIFRIVGRKVGNLFGNMRDRLASVGFWIRKHVFNKIGSALETMKNAFRSARDTIGKIWNGLKEKAAVPVNFVIDSVYNNGIRKAINALPGTQGLKEVPKIEFARGGGVFGGIAGRDSVNSLLMPGEHVLTAKEVQKLGGQGAVYKMRKAIQSGEFVGAGDLPAFAKGGGFTGDRIAETQAFAKRQSGKPYGWGAVGPSRYDCSGFMSALTNVLQGQSPHRRRGATADFPWGGFKKGIGQFTVGSSKNFSGGIGHMSGNLAGMGVESRGGRGVILGSGAMPTSRFDGQYHLGASGAAAAKSGAFWDAIQTVVGIFNKVKGWFTSLSKMGDWSKIIKQVVRQVANEASGFINKAIPGPGPIPRKFAKGGMVKARAGGTNITVGEAGYDEAIVPMGGPNAPGGGSVKTVRIDLDGEFGKWLLKILRKMVGDGGGNVQYVLGRKGS